MAIAYSLYSHNLSANTDAKLREGTTAALLELAQQVFPEINPDDFRWRIANMPWFSCCASYHQTRLVGFKLGYATKSTHYYSWLGAVDPSYLRRGIATTLMQQQHQWLRDVGFSTVETGAQVTNHPMRQLNLRSGFKEAGYFDKPQGREITYLKFL